jgi:hypothetical protein
MRSLVTASFAMDDSRRTCSSRRSSSLRSLSSVSILEIRGPRIGRYGHNLDMPTALHPPDNIECKALKLLHGLPFFCRGAWTCAGPLLWQAATGTNCLVAEFLVARAR